MQCINALCIVEGGGGPADSGPPSQADARPNVSDATVDTSLDAAPCLAGSLTIDATSSIVDFVVPDCITSLTIEVFGAEGGGSNGAQLLGGKGARIKGDFVVNSGETLQVLVGGKGADAVAINLSYGEQGGGSGGGGSFVVSPSGSAMIVAGGGGGSSHNDIGNLLLVPGGDGVVASSGQAGGNGGGTGGSAGGGGVTFNNVGFHGGTGGGGMLSGGVNDSVGDTTRFGTANAPGSSFVAGGAGGIAGSIGRDGGFGGGGSAGYTGGGGGGYSGGGAGGSPFAATVAGGGGGSINLGTAQDNSPGVRNGDGQVIIVWPAPQ